MATSDPTAGPRTLKTLYFRQDAFKPVSPGGILVAKTGMHTHSVPLLFGAAGDEHTHIQIGTNVNTSQQVPHT